MATAPKPEPAPLPEAKGEVEALMAIMNCLERLNPAQRARVLRYARDFFNVYMGDS